MPTNCCCKDAIKLMEALRQLEEVCWRNPKELPFAEAKEDCVLSMDDVKEAAARWQRFAAYFRVAFPETGDGIIESPLKEIPNMKAVLGVSCPWMMCRKQPPVGSALQPISGWPSRKRGTASSKVR